VHAGVRTVASYQVVTQTDTFALGLLPSVLLFPSCFSLLLFPTAFPTAIGMLSLYLPSLYLPLYLPPKTRDGGIQARTLVI
jgi:hypothetical protein